MIGSGDFSISAVGAEENRAALMQEDDSVRQFLGQPHIVGHDDAGQVQLNLSA